MKIAVELMRAHTTQNMELPDGATGFDLLRRLELAPDAHLLIRGDSPIPLDAALVAGEHLSVLSVVSGGTGSSPNL